MRDEKHHRKKKSLWMEQNHHNKTATELPYNQIKSNQTQYEHGEEGGSLDLPIDMAFKPLLSTLPKLTMTQQQHSIFKHHNN